MALSKFTIVVERGAHLWDPRGSHVVDPATGMSVQAAKDTPVQFHDEATFLRVQQCIRRERERARPRQAPTSEISRMWEAIEMLRAEVAALREIARDPTDQEEL